MSGWFKNLTITQKTTVLLLLTALTFLLLLVSATCSTKTGHFASFGVIFLAAVFFAAISVWASMQPIVRPLTNLTRHLQHLSGKQGDERFFHVTSNDEIGRLACVFNEMLQELDDDSAALEESAKVYRIVTEFSNEVAIWQLDNGDTMYISPNCLDFFGFSDAEFYENPDLLARIIHSEDRNEYTSHAPGSCATGGQGLEIRIVHRDGSIKYFRHHCHIVIDQDGRRNGIRSSYIDISGHRQMETVMARLSKALDQSGSIVIMTDTDGNIEYVNPAFCRSTGYSAEEVLGRHVSILQTENLSKEEDETLWEIIRNGDTWRGEFLNKRADGNTFWVTSTISPLFDKWKKVTGYLAVQEDISARKLSEQKMDELFREVERGKREWEETLDILNDFIIVTDSEHRVRRYNKILSDITGLDGNTLLGLDWRQLLHDSGFVFMFFNGKSGELLHKRSCRTYDTSIYPVTSETEGNAGYIVTLHDNTELRATTRELEKTLSELSDAQSQIYQQEKMASIGQLAAGVAHEINNPIGFITSNLGSLDKYMERISDYIAVAEQCSQGDGNADTLKEARRRLKIDMILEDTPQLIAESLDGAGRVRRIVQDLKSFSRVDQAETACIDLNEALETTINIAWNELKYVADLKREFGDIPRIKCFPQQLNQVFLNLLVNAAHAMGDTHGEIIVCTEQDGEQLLVKISDTGCGMPPEVQKRIFEPFFTTKEVGKGTGLGLSISYDIIKKHGGSIEVQSEVGHGTTFTVRLPVAGVEQPDAEVPS